MRRWPGNRILAAFAAALTLAASLAVLLVLHIVGPLGASDGDCLVRQMRVTNVSDVAFTVSWMTTAACTGSVQYGMSPGPLGSTAYDDRGSGISSQTHHITIGSLTPTKAYLFDIISDSVIDDNGGVHYTQTTGPSITGPSSRLVFGRVLQEDSATAAAGAIVYLYVKDGDSSGTTGESQAFSALADGTGTWNQNIGTIRQQSLLAYFSITEGDQLCLEAQWENLSGDAMCVPIGQTAPAANLVVGPIATASIPLVAGLNFIALPLEPMQSLKASTLAQAIAAQGGAVAQIDMWDESIGMWKSHVVGLEFNDFDIVLGRAYFLKVTLGVTWALKGHPLKAGVPLNLVTGLNGIGIPYSPVPLKFSRLAVEVAAQGGSIDQIDMWNQSLGRWESHKVGMAFNNFDIESWRGYFLKVTKGAAFDPGTIPVPTSTPTATPTPTPAPTPAPSAAGFNFPAIPLYSGGYSPNAIAVADFNGDMRVDVAVGNDDPGLTLRFNDGSGGLSVRSDYTFGFGRKAFAAADLDNDSRTDLAGDDGSSGNIRVRFNSGGGVFPPLDERSVHVGPPVEDFTIGDVNSDSFADFITVSSSSSSIAVILNNGDRTFSVKGTYSTSSDPVRVAVGDLNGDSWLDVVTVGNDGISVLFGMGDGTFAPRVDYLSGIFTKAVAVGDLNGDLHPDLSVALSNSSAVRLLTNNGASVFSESQDLPTRSVAYSIVLGDVSGDSISDIVVASPRSIVSVFIGNGDSTFQVRTDYLVEPYSEIVALSDINYDSLLDIIAIATTQAGKISVLLNRGSGQFHTRMDYTTGGQPFSAVTADLNSDSKLDVIVDNSLGNTISVLLGSGDGTLQPKQDYASGDGPTAIASADFNSDSVPDIAVVNNRNYTISIFQGVGNSTFLPKVDYPVGAAPFHIMAADLNGDSCPDLAVTNNWGDSVSVLLNNGSGGFLPKVDYATADEPRGLVVADLNGDSRLDLAVAAASAGRISVLVNNGDGTFQPRVDYLIAALTYPRSVAAADFDRDGDIDLAAAIHANGWVAVLLNDGNGTFAPHVQYSVGDETTWIVAADLNGDSYVDLATADYASDYLTILRNTGNGTFATAGTFATGDGPNSVHAADLNGDGKLDLVAVNFLSDTVSVLLNR